MTLRENIKETWFDMTIVQRVAVSVLMFLAVAFVIGAVWSSVRMRYEIRRLESIASRAEAEKLEAFTEAAKIATKIKAKEAELKQQELQIDEEYKKLDSLRSRRADAERNAERVRTNPRTDAPSTDKLCDILANAGHPCG